MPVAQSVNPRQQLGPYLLVYRDLYNLKCDDQVIVNDLHSGLDWLDRWVQGTQYLTLVEKSD